MQKNLHKVFLYSIRKYTSRTRRLVLRQDTDSLPVHEFPKSSSNKKRVYAWGFSETGALGMQTSVKKHSERYTAIVQHPTRLKFAENCDIKDVTAGYGFTAFAVQRSDGEKLFGTGLNTDCQLGLQQKDAKDMTKPLELVIYPTAISLPKRPEGDDEDMQVKCMAAGRAHLVVVTNSGAVISLGNNAYGQCGRPIIEKELYKNSGFIHRIDNLCGLDDEVVSVECGQDHTIFVSKKGKVFTCGWGADGQTGRGNYESTGHVDVADGDIENERIIKVSSRGDCVLALNDKGDVFGWGNSEYGQLFDSENSPPQVNVPRFLNITKGLGKIVDIAAGGSFCMVLNEEGDVFTWGYGILGFGPNVEHSRQPQQVLPALFGRTDFSPNSKVESIYCGVFHMGAVNTEGDLFMWGKNRFGCLGLGHKKDQYFPFKAAVNGKILKVSCGVDHTMALCKPFI